MHMLILLLLSMLVSVLAIINMSNASAYDIVISRVKSHIIENKSQYTLLSTIVSLLLLGLVYKQIRSNRFNHTDHPITNNHSI